MSVRGSRLHTPMTGRMGDDEIGRLGAESTRPSDADGQLALAWSRARELAGELRAAHEELALERRQRMELEKRLRRLDLDGGT